MGRGAFLLALFIHALLFILLSQGMRQKNNLPTQSEAILLTPSELMKLETSTSVYSQNPQASTQPTQATETANISMQKKYKLPQEATEYSRFRKTLHTQVRQKTKEENIDKKKVSKTREREQYLASLRDKAISAVNETRKSLGKQHGKTVDPDFTTSDDYLDLLRDHIKKNIIYTEVIIGNPTAIIEVELAPDGRVISQHLMQASTERSWDQAVQTAVKLSDPLPCDSSGKAPHSLQLFFSPKG